MSPHSHLPEFESEQHAEWRIRNADVLVLRLDRRTGLWTGERDRQDLVTGGQQGPQTLSPEEARRLAVAHDVRFRDGTKPV
jgi:hypothetical protein